MTRCYRVNASPTMYICMYAHTRPNYTPCDRRAEKKTKPNKTIVSDLRWQWEIETHQAHSALLGGWLLIVKLFHMCCATCVRVFVHWRVNLVERQARPGQTRQYCAVSTLLFCFCGSFKLCWVARLRLCDRWLVRRNNY